MRPHVMIESAQQLLQTHDELDRLVAKGSGTVAVGLLFLLGAACAVLGHEFPHVFGFTRWPLLAADAVSAGLAVRKIGDPISFWTWKRETSTK